jgi:hypothetical protein
LASAVLARVAAATMGVSGGSGRFFFRFPFFAVLAGGDALRPARL